ncbi:MAG: WD40 repeat domain-containing protein [Thiogranum sp.]
MQVSCALQEAQPPTIALERVHDSGAHRIAFSPDGNRLASGGLRGKLHIWSVRDGRRIATLDGHRSSIRGLGWLNDEVLVSADRSGLLNVWVLSSARVTDSIRFGVIQNIAMARDGAWLLVAENARIHKLSLPSLRPMVAGTVGSRILSVAISHAGERVAVSTEDGRVVLMDENLDPVTELRRPSRDAQDLRFSPNGKTLLAGGWFRLLVWDLEQHTLEERPTEHLGKVISVDISPDGRQWLSLGRQTDSNVRLVDAASNRVIRRFKAHELCGWQVRFSPDGRYAASSAEDGSVHIHDLHAPYRPVVFYPVFDD